jgi:hypothetical protein
MAENRNVFWRNDLSFFDNDNENDFNIDNDLNNDNVI